MKRVSVFLMATVLAVAVHAGALKPVTQQWVQSFHAPNSGDNLPIGVAIDNRGNAFVAGYELVSNAFPLFDFVTLKYSPSGVPLWTNYYDGPGHLWDQAFAMALDRTGNVFVTGISQIVSNPPSFTSYFNYVTIKYSNKGVPVWTNFYNGLTNADAQAQAIAIDPGSGAVYVGGFSIITSNSSECVTIKYSNAGVPLWTNSLTLSTNGFIPDARTFLAPGKNGTLFAGATVFSESSGEDYATFAYSSSGKPLWTNYYNGPGNGQDNLTGIAVDQHNNVFVTGGSLGDSTLEFATIAYSAGGTPLWTNRFNDRAAGGDFARAIAVNNRGNVFVAGSTSLGYGTVAYGGRGMPLWTNFYSAGSGGDGVFAMATQLNRAVFVTGSSASNDFATVEYSSSGLPISTNLYNGPANDDDEADAIAVAPNGSVYVTGYSIGTNVTRDITTIKYSPARGSH